MRLPNNFGTVYNLGGSRRKPFVAKKPNGIIRNGRICYDTVGYYASRDEALKALANYNPSPVAPKATISLKELYDEWSSAKFEGLSKQTSDCYKAGWKHLSRYGCIKVKDIRTAQIQSVINECAKDMSRSSLEKIKVVASMLLGYAMQNDIVNKNYAEFVKLPKTEKREKEIFNDIEMQKLEKAEDVPWIDTILILIYTGARINELLSLTRFNVDWDKQIITGGLKTDAGKNRIIPIHPKIAKHIKKWYDKGGDYLICNNDGKAIRDKLYREKYYYPALKQIGARELNPHCCRHTFASILRNVGADTVEIQKLIGHAKYSFTADTYTHTDIEGLRKAINRM